MMHSTLAMTALFWRAENPALRRSIQLEGIRHKGEALRKLRSRLGQSGSVDSEMAFLMSAMSTLVLVEVNIMFHVHSRRPCCTDAYSRHMTIILKPRRCTSMLPKDISTCKVVVEASRTTLFSVKQSICQSSSCFVPFNNTYTEQGRYTRCRCAWAAAHTPTFT